MGAESLRNSRLKLLRANATAFCNDSKLEAAIVCDVSPMCDGFSHELA